MIAMALERHETVKAVSVAPSRGAGAAGARAGRHSRFGAEKRQCRAEKRQCRAERRQCRAERRRCRAERRQCRAERRRCRAEQRQRRAVAMRTSRRAPALALGVVARVHRVVEFTFGVQKEQALERSASGTHMGHARSASGKLFPRYSNLAGNGFSRSRSRCAGSYILGVPVKSAAGLVMSPEDCSGGSSRILWFSLPPAPQYAPPTAAGQGPRPLLLSFSNR